MTSQYMCGICGRTVATFVSWKDVQPSDVIGMLEEELRSHNVNTSDMDPIRVLSRFRIVDDDDPVGQSASGGEDVSIWAGQ